MHNSSILPSEPTSVALDLSELNGIRVIGLLNNFEVFGQERANVEVFKALRRQGAQVLLGLTATHNGGALRKYVAELGFESFSLPYGCQWSKKFFYSVPTLIPKNFLKVYRCSQILREQAKAWKPTHIHIGNPLVYSFVAPFLAFSNVKLIYRMGDPPPYDSKANFWIWKRNYNRAFRVIANSQYIKQQISKSDPRGSKNIELIYNIAPGHSIQNAFRNRSSDLLRVLYVGQISEHKGVHHFVECAIALAKQNESWRFDIVGGSAYSRPMENALRERVAGAGLASQIILHGEVTDPTDFYRSALVTVVPSVFEEPAANVVLEAKSFGVPTIVYPSGGLPELISHQITGWVCAEKTAAALEQLLAHCLTQPGICRSMENDCLQEYEQRFGQARFDQEWARVYRPGNVEAIRCTIPPRCQLFTDDPSNLFS